MPNLSGLSQLIVGTVQQVPGWAQPVKLPDPGAGVLTVGRTVPGDTWERVKLARATFTADATVGTRNPTFQLVAPDGTVLYSMPVSTGVVASTAITVSLSTGGASSRAASGEVQERIPDIMLQSGYVWQLTVNAVGVADAWTGAVLYVARYSTDDTTTQG